MVKKGKEGGEEDIATGGAGGAGGAEPEGGVKRPDPSGQGAAARPTPGETAPGEGRPGASGSDEDAAEAGATGEEKLTLEERLRRLDEIVSALEAGDVELDRGLELFEEGVRHIRQAERVLARAELKVEELVGNEAVLETRPIEGNAGGGSG